MFTDLVILLITSIETPFNANTSDLGLSLFLFADPSSLTISGVLNSTTNNSSPTIGKELTKPDPSISTNSTVVPAKLIS